MAIKPLMKYQYLIAIAFFALCLTVQAENITDNHVAFLKSSKNPVDYFVDLFARHKIVVFAESLHPEMTQYEFLSQVIKHPAFAKRVRAVFTETGSRTQQEVMDRFLASPGMRVGDLIKINREATFYPSGWTNQNIVFFWQELWRVNSALPAEQKVWAYLSDLNWNWSALKTPQDYQSAMNSPALESRDMIMAKYIAGRINQLEKSAPQDTRQSYLVIMNTRHGLNNLTSSSTGKVIQNTGGLLKEAFGKNSVHCVLYHTAKIFSKTELLRDGLWDAAFAANNNIPAGFDLSDSPFGQDAFDYNPAFKAKNYAQAADGLIFFRPLTQYYKMEFFPGFYSQKFLVEVSRRYKIAQEKDIIQELIEQIGFENLSELGKKKKMLIDSKSFAKKLETFTGN
jgi:hypothetical protein